MILNSLINRNEILCIKHFIVALFIFITTQAQADVICEGRNYFIHYKIFLSTWEKVATVNVEDKQEAELFCNYDSKTINLDDNYPTSIKCKEKNSSYFQLAIDIDSKHGKGSGRYYLSSNYMHHIHVVCYPTQ